MAYRKKISTTTPWTQKIQQFPHHTQPTIQGTFTTFWCPNCRAFKHATQLRVNNDKSLALKCINCKKDTRIQF